MDKTKSHGAELKKEIDVLISKIDALEASVTDREKKSMMSILKVLAENQKHFADEFEHLKKALDLLTVQIFKMDQTK
jgi:predicted  nucleic acid-binding Zn-ribbon protein